MKNKLRIENRGWRKGIAGLRWVLVAGVVYSLFLLARAAQPAGGVASTPQAVAGTAVTFVPVDVYVDVGGGRLGAYQFEVNAKDATMVGLEGGDSKVFADAPYYDTAALRGNRIVVAAFSLDENLPTGLTRVARLHMMVEGSLRAGELPEMTDKLLVATDGQGRTVDAKLTLRLFAPLPPTPPPGNATQGETR